MLSPDNYLKFEMDFTFVFFKPIGLDDTIVWVRMKNPLLSPDHFGVRMGFLQPILNGGENLWIRARSFGGEQVWRLSIRRREPTNDCSAAKSDEQQQENQQSFHLRGSVFS